MGDVSSKGRSQKLLAQVFLAHIPATERNLALRKLATSLEDNASFATADLLALCLDEIPDDEAEDSLRLSYTKQIANGSVREVAASCTQSTKTTSWLLDHATGQLQRWCQSLVSRGEVAFIVPLSDLPNGPLQSENLQVLQEPIEAGASYIQFITCLLQSSTLETNILVSMPLVDALILLLLSLDNSIVSAVREALFALLTSFHNHTVLYPKDGDSWAPKVWNCVEMLVRKGEHRLHCSTGYQLWMRWLDADTCPSLLSEKLNTDAYWSRLQKSLAFGDVEQRKSCLHILKKSLALSESRNMCIKTLHMVTTPGRDGAQVGAQLDRYCTVYETIILGRYLNQIQECIQDLDFFASSDTRIERSWLYALLLPALASTMQDSIQKIIGNWFMTTTVTVDQHSDSLSRLFSATFLPWATQGQLFTSSLVGDTKNMQCEHGSRLTAFCARVLSTSDATASRTISETVLSYLNQNKNRIMPYAVNYILQSFLNRAHPLDSLTTVELAHLLELSTVVGFPEVARDCLAIQCYQLCRPAVESGQFHSIAAKDAKRLSMLESTSQQLLSKVNVQNTVALSQNGDRTSTRWSTIEGLAQELRDTRCRCLQGQGLVDACRSLSALLDNHTDTLQVSTLYEILDAVWCEVEIQDYPKAALLSLPAIFFHITSVSESMQDEEMAGLLSRFFDDYRQLVRGRIYIWSPFISSLRAALFTHTKLAERVPLTDLLIQVANAAPKVKVEFQLEAASSQMLASSTKYSHLDYKHYYGDYESLGYAAFFDLVNHSSQINDPIARQVLDQLLQPWLEQKIPAPVVNKWKTTEQLQIILMLLEQRLTRKEEAETYLPIIMRMLAVEPLPRYRCLLEWMVARMINYEEHIAHQILESLSTKDHHSNPKYLASLIKIAVMTCGLDRTEETFAVSVASVLVPLSSSSKIIIRHESQWCYPILWQHAERRGWKTITGNPPLAALMEYIKTLDRFSEPNPIRELERLDPVKDHTLVNLLTGGYLFLEPQGSILVSFDDFTELYHRDQLHKLSSNIPPSSIPLGSQPTSFPLHTTPSSPAQKPPASTSTPTALQTKGSAYLANTLSSSSTQTRPSPLIVIGTLVDNPYNLGGLSRVSEIFGAHTLYISSLSVLTNKDFISVAVASQNHLPVLPLPITQLTAFLTAKKTEGYTIVGIEQTDRSKVLGHEETVLSEKSVLIVGAEKEGIPAMVLGECDLLVEVPQRGVTRSLNVQTAAAAVLFEYERQRRGRA